MPHHTALPQSHGYAETSQSPVPTLTNSTSRSSSASSSVNSLSPEALATTPRDLLPQFKTAVGSVGVDNAAMYDQKVQHSSGHAKAVGVIEETDEERVQQRKRRRESGETSSSSSAHERSSKKKRLRHRKLTGSVDFVRRFGLYDLYEQYVRPYTGANSQQPLPDLASAYLDGVKGAAKIQTPGSLRDLVLMPPKNEFDRLDLLPMASIKPAFSIGSTVAAALPQQQQQQQRYTQPTNTATTAPASPLATVDERSGSGVKRPRIRVKLSTDSRSPSPGAGYHPYEREAAIDPPQQRINNHKKEADYKQHGARNGSTSSHHQQQQQHPHQQHQRQGSPPRAF
ncbi:hypothetical protein GQ54DRAFT_305950 [Martensiomyces pterosporus]|nr:hypothetical protein GQ54DRAFT_305950 [Martensiomyces pterosporus]